MADLDNDNPLGVSSSEDVSDFFDTGADAKGAGNDEDVSDFFSVNPVAETNIRVSRASDPNAFAKQRDNAIKLGVPVAASEMAPDVIGEMALDADVSGMLQVNPATSRFLSNMDNAKVAHDAVGELTAVEAAVNGLKRGSVRVEQSYHQFVAEEQSQQALDEAKTFGEILKDQGGSDGVNIYNPLDFLLAAERYVTSRVLSGAQQQARSNFTEVGRAAKRIQETPMSSAARKWTEEVEEADTFLDKVAAAVSNPSGMMAFSAEVGLEAIPQLFAASAATIASRNPGAGASVLGITSGLTERYASPQEFVSKLGVDLTDPRQVDALISNPDLMRAASEYGFTRGSIIGAVDLLSGGAAGAALSKSPLANVLLQVPLQMGFGGGGEALAQLATDGKVDFNEVIFEAFGELATTPVEVLGVGGQSLRKRVRDTIKVEAAKANVDALDAIKASVDASPVTTRSPDQAAEHVAETFIERGVESVFVPVDALISTAEATGDPVAFYEKLGVADQIADASVFNGDIRIPVRAFSQHVMQTDAFASVRDHVRMDEDSLTLAEAKEIESGTEVDTVLSMVSPDTMTNAADAKSMELAAHEMGMQAAFKTASEAGLTETQYATYLEVTKRAAEAGAKAKERARLRREAKKAGAKYTARREIVESKVRESLSNEPLYQALNSIGRERLDYTATLRLLGGDVAALEALPKVNGRRIYAPASQVGMDPTVFAEMHGFQGGDIFLFSALDNQSFDEAVMSRTDAVMEVEHPTLLSEREEIQEALKALHTDRYGDMIAFELARMRKARGQKQLKTGLVKAKAAELISKYSISEINSRSLEAVQRRESNRARSAVRKGDWETAASAKLNQLVAFYMTKMSYDIKAEVSSGNKWMRKFDKEGSFKSLPIDFRNTIQGLLEQYQLSSKLSDKNRKKLENWVSEKRRNGIPVNVPKALLDADSKTNYQDMSLSAWRDLHNTIRSIHKEGVSVDKLRRSAEAASVKAIVGEISSGVLENLSQGKIRTAEQAPGAEQTPGAEQAPGPVDVPAMETLLHNVAEAKRKFGVDVSTILLNTDSILRNIDGFKSLGAAYTYIKGGIDNAITEGYMVGQVGKVARMKLESERLVKIIDTYSKTERNGMWRERGIPGVRRRLSRSEVIGVLLNTGNQSNIQAMLDSGQFTEAELRAIVDSASKKDLDFAQNIWDFWGSFRKEIAGTVKRRQNRNVEMVEASPLQTPHGEYRGGYHPLQYDAEVGILSGETDAQEAIDMLLNGGFSASHTMDGHTKTREGSGGRPVKLDPFTINNHLQQLVYDLEVGDAVVDSYKVLHHPDLKEAFEVSGNKNVWDALDLWLTDVVTGEIHRGGLVEKSLRHIRTGTTISALALNASVAFLQPLGLFQTAAQIGKANTMRGLIAFMKDPVGTTKWVAEQSGFMAERERSFNKDVHDAQRGITSSMLQRLTPGRTADVISDAFFYPIAKAQKFVDIITWLGAKRQGLELFNGDDKAATKHADRAVARTQGSGNFQERTAFERGTINKSVRNTEAVRAWSLFLNYFAAKLNVAYERTKVAGKSGALNPVNSPIGFLNYASDIFMLYFAEALIISIAEGVFRGDDEEDEEDAKMEMTKDALWGGIKSFSSGVPVAREVTSAVDGFATGGAVGSFFTKVAKAGEQISQAEADEAMVKSINSVLGILFKYPTSQVHKTGQAIYDEYNEEDVELIDYLLGPKFDK